MSASDVRLIVDRSDYQEIKNISAATGMRPREVVHELVEMAVSQGGDLSVASAK